MRRLLPLALLATAAAPFDPFGAATIDERPGAQVPMQAGFRDAAGHATTLSEAGGGKPILLAPVLHQCPNFCGVTLDGLLSAVEATAPDARVIAFGIDPAEGPAAARGDLARLAPRHAASIGAVVALTGPPGAVHAVTDALGYRYAYDPRIRQYAHAAAVAVLTPDGRLVRWLYGIAPTSAAVRAGVADAAAGHTGGMVERLILLCYHYDPASGRYGLAIDRLLKAACGVTVLALAAFLFRARRREPRPC